MNEEDIITNESSGESDSETAETVQTVVYTEQLTGIQDYQQLQIALECVMIGVLLIFAIFNVLKRYI